MHTRVYTLMQYYLDKAPLIFLLYCGGSVPGVQGQNSTGLPGRLQLIAGWLGQTVSPVTWAPETPCSVPSLHCCVPPICDRFHDAIQQHMDAPWGQDDANLRVARFVHTVVPRKCELSAMTSVFEGSAGQHSTAQQGTAAHRMHHKSYRQGSW